MLHQTRRSEHMKRLHFRRQNVRGETSFFHNAGLRRDAEPWSLTIFQASPDVFANRGSIDIYTEAHVG
jgi:hypothetical protein